MHADTHRIERALRQYYGMKPRGWESISVSDVKQLTGGQGHGMYSFLLEYAVGTTRYGENLVLRLGDNEEALDREYRVLERLGSTAIPVPKAYETGRDMLGSFFIIMEKVEGQSLVERVTAGIAAAELAEILRQLSETLADIHQLNWGRAGFGLPSPPAGEYGFVEYVLSYYREREWSKQVESLGLTLLFDWLDKHKQPSDGYVLLHGDYHPANALVRDGKLVAVVDWDDALVGDAAYDVPQVPLFLKVVHTLSGGRLGDLSEVFLKGYRSAARKELKNLDYYSIVKAAQSLIFFSSAPAVGEEFRAAMVQTCVEQIEEMTGLTLPSSLTGL